MPPKKPTTDQLPLDGTAPDPAAPFKPYLKGEALVPEPQAAPLVPLQPPGPADDIMGLLRAAVDRGVPVETMEKLVTLHERVADRNARKEFFDALNRFQSDCPLIPKNRKSDRSSESGAAFISKWADIEGIRLTIDERLHEEGLGYSWDSRVEGPMEITTCTLRHIGGHAESSSFSCPTESRAGMSPQQKYASALTFGMRLSLIQVLGLTTALSDDGADAGSNDKIDAGKVATIRAMVDETKANITTLLKLGGVKAIEDLREGQYIEIVRALEAKRRKA